MHHATRYALTHSPRGNMLHNSQRHVGNSLGGVPREQKMLKRHLPTQSHISPSIVVYEEQFWGLGAFGGRGWPIRAPARCCAPLSSEHSTFKTVKTTSGLDLQGKIPTTCEVFPTLGATHGQIDGFFSRLLYKCHQSRVAYVGY